MVTFAPPVMERFFVNELTGCWIYRGKKDADGYGRVGHRVAHRVYYELLVGPVSDDLHLDHLCVRAACVNPDHLEPVTPAENQLRTMPYRGWERKAQDLSPTCKQGHEYTPENTRWVPRKNKDGSQAPAYRVCRKCRSEERRRARKRALANTN